MVPKAQPQVAANDNNMPKLNSIFKKSFRCSEKITHTPPNPNSKPSIALPGIFVLAENKPITTSHNGKIAPIIAPSPEEIYFKPQVLNPFANKKFKKLNTKIDCHS